MNVGSPLKILHFLGDKRLPSDPDRMAASGIVRAALELAAEQTSRGKHVTVAAVGPDTWCSEWRGVRLRSLRHAPWARFQLGAKRVDLSMHTPLLLLTHRQRFDVVYAHSYAYLRGVRAGRRVFYLHGDPAHGATAWQASDYEMLARHADQIVAVSSFVAKRLSAGLRGRKRVAVIHNGTSVDRRAADAHRPTLRAAWSAGEDDVVFLYAGAMVKEKGLVHLASAFRIVSQHAPQTMLVLAGSHDLWVGLGGGDTDPVNRERQAYVDQVRALLLDLEQVGRVRWLGAVPHADMAGVYSACDALVVPSVYQEPFGLVAADALASGRPVIASATGGLPEIVSHDVGFTVPAGDEQALAERCLELAASGDLRSRLGRAAIERSTSFSWAHAVDQLEELHQTSMLVGDHA